MQDYITTTDLRTKSSKLVETLKRGQRVSLIHRSKVIGKIEPVQDVNPSIVFDVNKFKKFLERLGPLEHLSVREREKRYRKQLQEKYGKNLS